MKTRVQQGYYTVGADRRLEWLRIHRSGARSLLFVPPLIGGNFSQPAVEFRFLIRQGFDLFSFSFSGHENSGGRFSLGKSIEDTEAMLSLAATMAGRDGLRIDGVGICYSAIPLLHAIRNRPAPVARLVLISAVPALNAGRVLRAFVDFVGHPPVLPDRGIRLSKLPEIFGEFMLPGVSKNRRQFGLLSRRRAKLVRILCELLLDPRFKALSPVDLPVLCLYGSQDRVLQMYERSVEHTYEARIRQICRRVQFQRLSGDHRLRPRAAKREARRWIGSFLAPGSARAPARIS